MHEIKEASFLSLTQQLSREIRGSQCPIIAHIFPQPHIRERERERDHFLKFFFIPGDINNTVTHIHQHIPLLLLGEVMENDFAMKQQFVFLSLSQAHCLIW